MECVYPLMVCLTCLKRCLAAKIFYDLGEKTAACSTLPGCAMAGMEKLLPLLFFLLTELKVLH